MRLVLWKLRVTRYTRVVTGLASDERDEKDVVVRRRGVWSEVLSIWRKKVTRCFAGGAGVYIFSSSFQVRQGGV